MEMIENLMNKTSEVVEKDMERVKEINRLKEKVNDLLTKLRSATREYINPTHPADIVGSLRFCKKTLEKFITKHWGGNGIILSSGFINSLSWSIRYEINKMMNGENQILDKMKDQISMLITRLVNKKKTLNPNDTSYLIGEEGEERYLEDFNKNGYCPQTANYTEDKLINDKEKLIDINNY